LLHLTIQAIGLDEETSVPIFIGMTSSIMQPLTTQASGLVEENSVSVFIDMTS
jgi:hypothetical protein